MADGSIKIDTKIDNTDLDKQLKGVKSSLSKGLSGAAKAAKTAMIGLGAATASVSVGVRKFTQDTDRIDKMSQRIGISREAFQEFDFILSQSGASMEGLERGMKNLAKRAEEASDGAGIGADRFAQLGVSVTTASGQMKTQEQILTETLTSLQGMDSGARRTAIAQDLLGRSAQELEPLLNGEAGNMQELTEKAHELGIVLGDEAVDSGVRLTDKLDQLGRTVSALTNNALAPIVPEIEKTVTNFTSWATEGDRLKNIVQGVVNIVGAFLNVIGPIVSTVFEIVSGFMEWISEAENLQKVVSALEYVIIGATSAFAAFIVAFKIGSILSAVSTGFLGVATAIKAVTVAIAANPIGAIAVAITSVLIPAIIYLIRNWDDVSTTVSTIIEKLKQRVTSFATAIITGLVQAFNSVKVAALEFAQMILDKLFGALGGFLDMASKIPGVGDMFADVGSSVDNLKASIDGEIQKTKDSAAASKQAAIDRRDAVKRETNANIAAIDRESNQRKRALDDNMAKTAQAADENKQKNSEVAETERQVTTAATERGNAQANASDKATESIEETKSKLQSMIEDLEGINSTASSGIEAVSDGMDLLTFAGPIGKAKTLYDGFMDIADITETIAKKGPKLAKEFMDGLLNTITSFIESLPKVVDNMVDMLVNSVVQLVEKAPQIITAISKASAMLLPALNVALIKSAPDLIKALIMVIPLTIIELVKSIPDILTSFVDVGKELVDSVVAGIVAVKDLPSVGKRMMYNIIDGIKAVSPIWKHIKALFTNMIQAITNIFTEGPGLGKAFIEGIISGILNAPDMFMAVVQVFRDFLAAIAGFFGIASPSTVFAQFGGDMIRGMIQGIVSIGSTIWTSVSEVFTILKEQMLSAGKATMNGFRKGLASMKGPIKNVMGSIANIVKNAVDKIKGLAKTIADKIGSAAKKVADKTKNMATKAAEGAKKVGEKVKDIGGKVKGAAKKAGDKVKKIFGFARGTNYAPGGPAIVGEEGPELVELPKGARVHTAQQTRNLMQSGLKSVRDGIAGSAGMMRQPGQTGAKDIVIRNVINGVVRVDGREIGRVAFENIDRHVRGAYGY